MPSHYWIIPVLLFVQAGCAKKSEEPMAASNLASNPSSAPASSMVFGLGPGFELAPKANYSAAQKAGEVTITARGENPTAGYEVKLVQSPLRIWPPQWMLARKHPEGMAAQVMTPFEVTATFKSDDPIKAVIVGDAAGRHEVPVEQAGK
jgi:hypothetical protein